MAPRLALVLIAAMFAALLAAALLKVLVPPLARAVKDLFGGDREDAPPDWHGLSAPTCRACGYDLRGSPNHCPECGQKVDPLDAVVVRYLISVGHRPPEGCEGEGGFKVIPPRRGETRLR